ncbi:hypothetical protein FQN51_003251 [Onygenales sp. PD_10]|nr:hypothetical protein FQN51_003251 [Onygenales sp. PD_10]
MDNSRQQAFLKLRPPCVELSSVGLKFRADLASSKDVLKALETVHSVLNEISGRYGLDEKLAEYAFFPLTHIFNETQRVSVRCLELAVRCLQILIEKGWRQKLSIQLGKQLLILLTLMAGGTPGQNKDQAQRKPDSEELSIAAFECVGSLCQVLAGPAAAAAIFNEIGTSTVIDQTVYVLLEGVMDGSSDKVQLSAATALRSLNARITHRVVLASLLPRSVSALTKALRPTTQMRRSYQVLCCCLETLTEILRGVLNDADVAASATQEEQAEKQSSKDTIALDDSWLNATSSQIKLALANVIRLRTHDRDDVRHVLLELCLMVIEQCPKSLSDSLSMMVETVVVLAETDERNTTNDAFMALKHLTMSSGLVSNILKSSMHTWIIALPRMMRSNDDVAKQRAIRQISTAFQVLSETQPSSEILDDTLATSLRDSVSAAIKSTSMAPQPLPNASTTGSEISVIDDGNPSTSFQPVLMEHRSQQRTLSELHSMISKLSSTDTSLSLVQSMLKMVYVSSGEGLLAPFWLTLSFLKSNSDQLEVDDMLDIDTTSPSRSAVVEELYSISLPLLTDLSSANPTDWRLPALALEAVALQAQQLGESFRPELIDALYPILQLMGSSNPNLRHHAMTCLNILTGACNYPNASTMLVDNVDYLVNSVSLKLNTFDISPQAPQVLLMMVRLCGASLIPYLDDLVGSIFAVLDAFHGYPKLVELLFSVLGTIVDEGAKMPAQLAITGTDTEQSINHLKTPRQPRSIADIASQFKRRKEKRSHHSTSPSSSPTPHPKRPWTAELDGPQPEPEPMDEDETPPASETDHLPPPNNDNPDEKPLSKSHTLLLNIAKSIPPHLSSPSPFLRRSLLTILTRALPILSHDENTFLPLINDTWPSVSARITAPPTFPSDSSSTALATAPTTRHDPTPRATTIDESGIREETYVTVAACATISAMCEGAGDFMSSRLEHEFPRWKKLYLRCWERVRHDSEKAAERQRLRIEREQRAGGAAVDGMEALTLGTSNGMGERSLDTSRGVRPPRPPPLPSSSKLFTPHNSLFQALTGLFTTMLSNVHLADDVSDEICEFLGEAIAFYRPGYYFTYAWREKGQSAGTLEKERTEVRASGGGGEEEVDKAIRAMDVWNADLTWFVFEKGRRRAGAGGSDDRLRLAEGNIEKRIGEMMVRKGGMGSGDGRWEIPKMVGVV